MFRHFTVTVLFFIIFCGADNPEIHCSRYHYEEQILAKLVRLEHRLEQLEKGSSTQNAACTQCPDSWMTFQGSCYLFSEETRTFIEAELHCNQHNAHLVHVEDELENVFLKSHLQHLKGEHSWMGLTDTEKEGTFKWYGTEKIASFTDWAGGQPDNAGGREHCVHFYHGFEFKWNDSDCEHKYKSICEKKANAISLI